MKMTQNEFIKHSQTTHGDKYIYDSVIFKKSTSDVVIICKKHGPFTQCRKQHLAGKGCGLCIKYPQSVTDSIIERFKIIHGDKYNYEHTFFTTLRNKIEIGCKNHGIFLQRAGVHLKGCGCPKCAKDNSRSSTSKFITISKRAHGDKYDYTRSIYTEISSKLEILCRDHGHFWQTPKAHYSGQGCPACANKARRKANTSTTVQFIRSSRLVHGDAYVYDFVEYINNTTPVKIFCKIHSDCFMTTPMSHLCGSECPKCAMEKVANSKKYNTEIFKTISERVHGNLYDYSESVYVDSVTKVKIRCRVHGIFEQTPGNHNNSTQGCPKCSNSISKAELEIVGFIKSLETATMIETSNKQILDGMELDIVIPEYNVAIEYDGIYWHSEQNGKGKKYHIEKTEKCESKKLQLLHIFENEWRDPIKRDVWKSIIINKLKLSHVEYARKCKVIRLSPKVSNAFFEINHLQGRGYSEHVSYGLVNDPGVLVSAMSFSSPRYGRSYDWELLRMCNKIGYSITGGFSRLLTHFRRDNSGSIISYANRRFSNGNVYDKLGFEFIENTPPGYWYHLKGSIKLMHRSTFMKHKLADKLNVFDNSKTEYENMVLGGYDRIWDCGTKSYCIN